MYCLRTLFSRNIQNHTFKIRGYAKKDPFKKTLDVLGRDLPFNKNKEEISIEHTDVVIIGGGIIGSSIAYWLKTRTGHGLSVAVIEKDPTFKKAQINSALCNLHRHYALPENILLSQYSADFYRNIKKNLDSNVNIHFRPNGYLVLASEKYAERLEYNVKIQSEFGIKNEILSQIRLKERFPWMNFDDIKLGCISTESEGVFDSWCLHKGLIDKSISMGATYINGKVIGFNFEHLRDVMMEGVEPGSYRKVNVVKYIGPDNEEREIKFALCILAAGSESQEIALQAGIGNRDGLLTIPLPIESRKYNIYSVETNGIGIDSPFVMDTTGLWLRKQILQNELLCGVLPSFFHDKEETEQSSENLLELCFKNRISTSQNAKIKHVGTEICDFNTFDGTGIIGPHPYYNNLYLATGFGPLGYQHAPGIGKAIAELIVDSQYKNIDLTRFCFDRIMINKPMIEFNMY